MVAVVEVQSAGRRQAEKSSVWAPLCAPPFAALGCLWFGTASEAAPRRLFFLAREAARSYSMRISQIAR